MVGCKPIELVSSVKVVVPGLSFHWTLSGLFHEISCRCVSRLWLCDLLEHTSNLMCPIVIFSGQINDNVLRQGHKFYIFQ